MIVIGLIVSAFGIGFLCWLMFMLAVYALPFFAAITVGLAVYHSGAGVLGAPVVGLAAGAVTLVVARFAFAVLKLPALRGAIAFIRGARRHCRLSRNAGACPNRRPLDGLARNIRYCRGDVRRWNGTRSRIRDGHLARHQATWRRALAEPRMMAATKQR